MSDPVRAKKHLGQHFLNDEETAEKIGNTLSFKGYDHVLEIGPGTGVLTKYLLEKDVALTAMDLDQESVDYLKDHFSIEHASKISSKSFRVLYADFLKYDLSQLFGEEQFAITGNFPYNISTQIVFKTLELRDQIPEFTGMFQKEVAKRICEKEGSKAFNPPPKVESGVLRLTRKEDYSLNVDEKLFFRVVKQAFQQRRKTLRNSLKTFQLSDELRVNDIFNKRPEQLSVAAFLELTALIQKDLTV